MRLNPELRRNVWLELTPTRLVAMPAVLGGVFVLSFVGDGRRLGPATSVTALSLLVALTWLWGAHLASESVMAELRGRTWDWQRMSGLRAWTLAWGKLVGSTVFAWYGGAICLLVYALAEPEPGAAKGRLAALALLGAVLSQSAALLAALQAATRDRTFTRAQSTAYLFAAALVLYPLLAAGFAARHVEWYGLTFASLDLTVGSMSAFASFAVVGAWVQVRRELRFRTLPLAWPAFVAFVMAWTAGFAAAGTGRRDGAAVAVALAVAAFLTWATAFLERKDPVALARIVRACRDGRWRHAAGELPAWLLTLPFVVGTASVLVIAPRLAGAEVPPWTVRGLVAAGVMFLGRDLALLLGLNLGPRPRRADLFAAILLLVAYLLVPLILDALRWHAAIAIFLPYPDHALLSALSAAVQCCAAWVALARRWDARRRDVEGAAAVTR